MISINTAQEMLDEICRLCRRLNQQHADCNWCHCTDAWRDTIKDTTQDAELGRRTGQLGIVLRQLGPDEVGKRTGPMYRIRFQDGFEAEVFEDELAYAKAKSATEEDTTWILWSATQEQATESLISTQAHLRQEWGQERYVTALGALTNWTYQIGPGRPPSTQQILALQEANDDAFQLFSARTLHPDPKPPPDWSTTVKIPIRDVLDWHLHNDKVSWAIIAAAGLAANVPPKYEEWWTATNIEISGDHLIVHLAAWDADITP